MSRTPASHLPQISFTSVAHLLKTSFTPATHLPTYASTPVSNLPHTCLKSLSHLSQISFTPLLQLLQSAPRLLHTCPTSAPLHPHTCPSHTCLESPHMCLITTSHLPHTVFTSSHVINYFMAHFITLHTTFYFLHTNCISFSLHIVFVFLAIIQKQNNLFLHIIIS